MKTKKNKSVNLESHKKSFLLIGFTVALGIAATAFSWSSHKSLDKTFTTSANVIETEDIPITREIMKRPEPKPAEKITIIDQITEVPDETIIVEPIDFTSGIDGWVTIDLTEPEEIEPTDFPVITAEHMPEYPGGIEGLMHDMAKNTVYPAQAREADIYGTVYIKFVVSKTGKVENIELARGVDPLLNEAAIAAVKKLKDFTPGSQNGRPVSVYYSLPVKFKLN